MILDKKSLKLAKKILFLVSLFFVFFQTAPQLAYAMQETQTTHNKGPIKLTLASHPDSPQTEGQLDQKQITNTLPENIELPYYETYITTTAYTSREAETDSSPYIAAWGDHVFWGMIASNAFPRGTKIQIPDYFGDKMFTVLDTMNKRYYYKVDIWMPDLKDARTWGAKYVRIKVYK